MQTAQEAKTEAVQVAGWCVDDMTVETDMLRLRGWSLDPMSLPADWASADLEIIEIKRAPRPDLDALFDFVEDTPKKGFELSARPIGETWTLRRGEAASALHAFSGPADPSSVGQVPKPPADQRFRVHGGRDWAPFLIEGLSAARKIEYLAGQLWAEASDRELDVLDWGCGCGRVSRWLHRPHWRLSGVDIDHENAAWCRENLGQGEAWLGCNLVPPLPFEPERFDLIFGISVFTHLAEEAQFVWLTELQRILKPGGRAIVTVHGAASAARFSLTDAMWARWQTDGFFDLGPSGDLVAVFGEHEHYRGSLHTPGYVRDAWSPILTVEDTLQSVVGNHQDVVILRR